MTGEAPGGLAAAARPDRPRTGRQVLGDGSGGVYPPELPVCRPGFAGPGAANTAQARFTHGCDTGRPPG